ncbi:hypothetical protein DACRYDRAFT_18224 [Dacryopinax primogenitus]|uniref:Uncharacterized protein n=1 Tax=Dacryopinax primogenitus (strain DJM 731) TaxID=1858805 RepID=M5FSI3_DACPD|nr:uncharacterized protein DACRYDRAFT_18224 [Dacryopinax primogenitus]EJT98144.1 hypothetical protein DACRYDRAFT_18224 [Dacryopinax primogenitus]
MYSVSRSLPKSDITKGAAKTSKALEKKAEAERKKAERLRLKAEKDAAKAAEKAHAKAVKTVNKLISSKKDTLPDMFVETIVDKSGKPGARDWPIRVVDELDPPNSICWTRRVKSRYDEGTRQFVPLDEPLSVIENARLLYLQKEHLQNGLKSGRLEQTVQRLRDELGPKALLFAMIDGGGRSKETERQLTMRMMKYQLNVIRVDGYQDAATWLYDMTADLGYKPYRLLEKSHLPNIGDTNIDAGANSRDTWYKMLLQVPRMTESAAQGIMKEYPTFHSLMSTYQLAGWQGERLLENILITKRKDGMDRQRQRLGGRLSNRVWRSLTSEDPDEHLAQFGQGAGIDDDDD